MSKVSLINGHIDGAETCVICGRDIPEGSQVCVICGKTEPRDLVEVVRCKDCEYFDGIDRCDHPSFDYEGHCYDFWLDVKPTDFCSYGERRGKE